MIFNRGHLSNRDTSSGPNSTPLKPVHNTTPSEMTKLKCPDYGGVLISEGVVLCTGFNGVTTQRRAPECNTGITASSH